jgi:glycosyltransferase involved in cell wall biosynthesis
MNTNKFPLVSFVIPYYNHKQYVKLTLDSILEDSYPNKEIVIINDGSTDSDLKVINSWISENSKSINIKFISRENKGITKTLNELISISKGKYILACASDDYLINDTVMDRVRILEDSKKHVLISDVCVIDEDNNVTHNSLLSGWGKSSNVDNYLTDDGIKFEIINRWSLAGACVIIKKDIFKKIGYYDESSLIEDWDFFLRAAANNSILFHNKIVSAYRRHDTNISSGKTFKMLYSVYLASKKNYRLFNKPYKGYLLRKKISYQIQMIFFPLKHLSRVIKGKLYK